MKYINELAYSNHIAQTKHLAKDKRQKNKYRQMPLLDKTQDCDDVHEEDLNQLSTQEKENNRRDGSDRRKAKQNRGRYVESRQNKNRRYQKELSLLI